MSGAVGDSGSGNTAAGPLDLIEGEAPSTG